MISSIDHSTWRARRAREPHTCYYAIRVVQLRQPYYRENTSPIPDGRAASCDRCRAIIVTDIHVFPSKPQGETYVNADASKTDDLELHAERTTSPSL